jgi:squalene-hopene/tetraprenyl-beta-curcumene cyclase
MSKRGVLATAIAALSFANVALAQPARAEVKPPTPNRADEPMIQKFSLARAGEFLDAASVTWTNKQRCGTCHTNFAYMMARPTLKDQGSPAMAEVRGFFETRALNWDKPAVEGQPNPRPRSHAEVVMTAATLAFNDAHTTNRLHPATRQALGKMWSLQRRTPLETLPAFAFAMSGSLADKANLVLHVAEFHKLYGSWNWIKCEWPPAEHDDYYGVILGLIGACVAPENYRATPEAKAGIARAVAFLRMNPPPTIHHRAMLLWAATYVPEVMSERAQKEAAAELLRLQQADGGWCLHQLGPWQGFLKGKSPVSTDSDGYATGLVIYVLRRTGVPADDPAIRKGVAWLKANQRESGRWFTTSLNTDRYHYISHMGTAYAVLALRACGVE